MKGYLLFFCFFVFQAASKEVKYKPIASPLNHGVSGGFVFEPPLPNRKKLLGSSTGASLSYIHYFSSWDRLLPKNYRGHLNWGLEGGIKLLRSENKTLCVNNPLPAFIYGGAQMRVTYLDTFQPFIGFGLNHAACRNKEKIRLYYSATKLKPSFSFGASISLKFLEASAIYSLDSDYGLNDLSFFTRCFQVKKTSELKGRFICQFGMEVLF